MLSSLSQMSRFRKDCRPYSLKIIKMKPDKETSPEYQIGRVTALARVSDSLVNFSIVSFKA